MITNFKEYLNDIRELENRTEQMIENAKKELKDNFQKELSKYLEFILMGQIKIFLIDDDYGLIVQNAGYNKHLKDVHISVYSAYKNDMGKWIANYKNSVFYSISEDVSVEDFAKQIVERFKKYNVIRKIDKMKRQFKKSVKKYNI